MYNAFSFLHESQEIPIKPVQVGGLAEPITTSQKKGMMDGESNYHFIAGCRSRVLGDSGQQRLAAAWITHLDNNAQTCPLPRWINCSLSYAYILRLNKVITLALLRSKSRNYSHSEEKGGGFGRQKWPISFVGGNVNAACLCVSHLYTISTIRGVCGIFLGSYFLILCSDKYSTFNIRDTRAGILTLWDPHTSFWGGRVWHSLGKHHPL